MKSANRILCLINALIALICAGLVAVMLWAIAIRPTWEFVVIALIALILADVARTRAIHIYRQSKSH